VRRSLTAGLFVILSLTVVLTSASEIRQVKASGTIYIRAGGSIDPPSANITTLDNVTYTFTDNNYDGIVVERDHIVIDGAGYAIQGNGSGIGIHLSGRSSVTVKNMEIRAFERGIRLDHSSNNTISANNVTYNEFGIVLYSSSTNNTLRHNDASDNRYNFGVFTASVSGYIQNIDDSNTVNGKPVYYWVNRQDMTVPPDAGYVVLVNCTRITVKNLNLTKNMQGVALAFTTNSIITNNNLINNFDGIRLDHSSNNNVISGNNITASTHYGIRLFYDPSSNLMLKNNVANNDYGGQLDGSSCNNTISGNNITNNETGIRLDYSSNNTICTNNVANNLDGIGLYGSSSNNTVSGNNIANSNYGIWFISSYSNSIYHNNFIDNTMQVIPSSRPNFWDAGYPSGGNYWSDYTGSDSFSGPNQNLAGSDGIGDIQRVYNNDNRDNYPLMEPWLPSIGIRDVALLNVTPSATRVYLGSIVNINATVKNNGDFAENRTVTVYYNSTPIESQTVSLSAGENLTLTFVWDTTSLTPGNYTIKAAVSIFQGEANVTNNSLTYSLIKIKMLGDVNGDSKIDIKDIATAAAAFGCFPGHERWNPDADINQDNKLDIKDLVLIASHFGETYS